MHVVCRQLILITLGVLFGATSSWGQLAPSTLGTSTSGTQGLRPVTGGLPSTTGTTASSNPGMVPLNPTRNLGFDPYASTKNFGGYGSLAGAMYSQPSTGSAVLPPTTVFQPPSQPYAGTTYPGSTYSGSTYSGSTFPGGTYPGASYPLGSSVSNPALTAPGVYGQTYNPYGPSSGIAPGAQMGGWGQGGYPSYNGPSPILPGGGQSAIVQTSPSVLPNNYNAPGVFPNTTPSALFPGSYGNSGGGLFGGLFGGANNGFGGSYGSPYNQGGYNWNPNGSVFNGQFGEQPGFIRLFQGPRIRHAYLHGDHRHNDVSINDTDVAIAMLLPNFAFSNQPIYILPSFSLHQWAGPRPDLSPANNADLPSKAYSAFIDTGWQSDPNRILGAELGVRVGVFTDFNTLTTKSIRIQGRGIGRIRLTPQATLKLGVMYLDRNRVKLLPAGGILWQPNPATRLDLFFPEPKLSSFLTTVGNMDTWWYVAGYYGGGNWRIQRTDGSKDNVDINDIRIALGLEWGRNDMMRDGRRIGFAEIGYVFDRELIYKARPGDNLNLHDTFVIRAGIGY